MRHSRTAGHEIVQNRTVARPRGFAPLTFAFGAKVPLDKSFVEMPNVNEAALVDLFVV
jgi:hypothetical protein